MILELSCNGPYYTQFSDLQHAKTNSPITSQLTFHPPPFIIVGRRNVSFDDHVDVYEVEKPTPKESESIWYSKKELSRFMKRCSKDTRFSTRGARAFNHTRRTLLHQKALKQMGSKDLSGLSKISRQCSYKAKLEARELAEQVARKVKRQTQWSFVNRLGIGSNDGVADFYLNYFLNLIPKTFCGSAE
jgi:hypothetical protein